MEVHILYRIMTFFDNIDDMLNDFIDKIELTPVQIANNLYVTGLRRSSTSNTAIDLHIKQIRKIKLDNINAKITDDGGWYMMEPDNEIWLTTALFSENVLEKVLAEFIKTMGKLNSFHIMTTRWKDEKDNFTHVETSLYENKRVACKEALAMRKIHKNVSNKFEAYNSQGELIKGSTVETTQHEPSDFELVTAKC